MNHFYSLFSLRTIRVQVIMYNSNNPVSAAAISSYTSRNTWAGTHYNKLEMIEFTHRSGFVAHFLLHLLHFAPVAVFQALARRGHAQNVVISAQAAVATGATVMNRLITDTEREASD